MRMSSRRAAMARRLRSGSAPLMPAITSIIADDPASARSPQDPHRDARPVPSHSEVPWLVSEALAGYTTISVSAARLFELGKGSTGGYVPGSIRRAFEAAGVVLDPAPTE